MTAGEEQQAEQAMRDILFMYYDLAESHQGFGPHVRSGSFDAFRYLEIEEETVQGAMVDIDLLREGSAIALFCQLYDHWVEFEDVSSASPWLDRLRRFVSDGRFFNCPDVGDLIAETFERNLGFHDRFLTERSQPIYLKYVAGYFARLGMLRRA